MEKVFRKLTGFNPFPFQIEAANRLLTRNQVITAPTGSGKTWMSILPFIYAKENNLPFADRLFYVLPQRTLVTSISNTISPILNKLGLNVTVQMGGQNDDPFFEGDVIVTTIDQLLSTYIGISYASNRNSSNIAPGALLGSYIILDEFHLLEVEKSLATFLDLVNRLEPFVRVCMMTATAPQSYLEEITMRISGDYYIISPEKIVQLQEELGAVKKRILSYCDEPITSKVIIEKHVDRTLVVVNTVKRVQALYGELKEHMVQTTTPIKIICLHARFLKEDREKKEHEIKQYLSKNSNENVIIIANQVVEVGLDVSATVLITEICEANALIQRIGRCARHGEVIGKVYVHKLSTDNALPYRESIVDMTKRYLEDICPTEITAIEEEKIVEYVHKDLDANRLKELSLLLIKENVEKSIISGDVSNLRNLIRDVDNIQVLIHDAPWEIDYYKKPQQFSVPTNTLISQIKDSSEVIFYPEFPEEARYGQQPEWKQIKNPIEVKQHLRIAISPSIASYSNEIGFVFTKGNFKSQETVEEISTNRNQFSYTKETYIEHVMDVRRIIRNSDEAYSVFVKKAAELLGVEERKIHECTELVGALHDIGKLQKKYVKAVRWWQKEVIGAEDFDFLAHNDFNPKDQTHIKALAKFDRGTHAVEGACISSYIFQDVVENICFKNEQYKEEMFRAMFYAIKRHHGAYVEVVSPFQLENGINETVEKSLSGLHLGDIELLTSLGKGDVAEYKDLALIPFNQFELLMYWHFVRRLRLADRKSQEEKI